ncbi:MAG: BlaI/MecI/CopY family transcriptional regulator [Clostridium butyricum]|nr:BlaI/MecI/CopY family transcriptional regulator [Clostridium butyricum]MDU5821247.1 BlaI/MecI/CopY family transcriptional regulator [Clostridium butyricum]
MSNISKISDSEWTIMEIIWQNSHCTAMFIIKKLENSTDWKPKTIKTLIRRLVDKGVVGYEQEGREYKYYSLVDESECKKNEGISFLKRVYGGSLKAMMLNFLESDDVSQNDIDDLRKYLNEEEK